MTKEYKDLLIQDLCARLPYNVHVNYKGEIYDVLGISYGRLILCKPFMSQTLEYCPLVEEVKLCLFPMSSMTEEQRKYIADRWNVNEDFDFEIDPNWGKYFVVLDDAVDYINWLIENHFDFQNLIPKKLAIDSTNLNIY